MNKVYSKQDTVKVYYKIFFTKYKENIFYLECDE